MAVMGESERRVPADQTVGTGGRRKRQRRKAARPGEIIEAGLQEFAEKGFAAARLEDVAARAGIVKGTIYRYFENKQALFEAVVRSRILPVLDEAEALIERYPGSSQELLLLVIRTIYEKIVAADGPVIMRIIIAEGGRFPDIPAYYHRETISKGQAILKKILARGVARGEFRESAAAKVPIVLMAPAIVAAIWKMTFEAQQPIAIEQFLEAHVDVVLNGIKR